MSLVEAAVPKSPFRRHPLMQTLHRLLLLQLQLVMHLHLGRRRHF